jgi:hypothetical protein
VEIPVPADNETTWSGAVLVTVIEPDVVIGLVPESETPVPATNPTEVTVPLY